MLLWRALGKEAMLVFKHLLLEGTTFGSTWFLVTKKTLPCRTIHNYSHLPSAQSVQWFQRSSHCVGGLVCLSRVPVGLSIEQPQSPFLTCCSTHDASVEDIH